MNFKEYVSGDLKTEFGIQDQPLFDWRDVAERVEVYGGYHAPTRSQVLLISVDDVSSPNGRYRGEWFVYVNKNNSEGPLTRSEISSNPDLVESASQRRNRVSRKNLAARLKELVSVD